SLIRAAWGLPDASVEPRVGSADPRLAKGAAVVGQKMIGGRVARVVVLAAVLGLVGTGSASAAPVPLGNAAFTRAGVKVYAEGAVGLGCQTFGFCNGVAADLAGSASPQYVSTRP